MNLNVICDKAGYALNVGDKVEVKAVDLYDKTESTFTGTVTGLNAGSVYAIRVTDDKNNFNWYKRGDIRKLANQSTSGAKVKAKYFRI